MKIEASFEVNLEMIQREERITATYELNTRKARTHQIHPQGQLILDVVDPKQYIIEADGAREFFRWLEIAATTTAQWELDGIHSINVQVRYAPKDGGHQFTRDLVLTPSQPTDTLKTGVLRQDGDSRKPMVYWYEYKVTVHYTQDVVLGNQQGSVTSIGSPNADAEGWIRTTERNLVIHPRDITPAVTVNVATGVMQYDLLQKAELELAYGPYRQNVQLSADKKDHRLVIRPEPGLGDARLRTEGILYYKDQARVPLPAQEWVPRQLVVINEPRENILRVRALLADPAHDYTKVMGSLRYEQANRIVEQPFELKNHADVFDWAVRLEDPEARDWKYQATLIKKSGDVDTIPWTEGKDDVLILGIKAVDVLPVQVAWLIPLPVGDVIAAQVDLAYDDDPNRLHWTHSELIRQGHAGTFNWSVPILDAARRSFRYRVTEFRTTGRKELPWQDSDNLLVVLAPSS
jgi:hypothetical protein